MSLKRRIVFEDSEISTPPPVETVETVVTERDTETFPARQFVAVAAFAVIFLTVTTVGCISEIDSADDSVDGIFVSPDAMSDFSHKLLGGFPNTFFLYGSVPSGGFMVDRYRKPTNNKLLEIRTHPAVPSGMIWLVRYP